MSNDPRARARAAGLVDDSQLGTVPEPPRIGRACLVDEDRALAPGHRAPARHAEAQAFVHDDAPIRRSTDTVGEGAADVDRDLPHDQLSDRSSATNALARTII